MEDLKKTIMKYQTRIQKNQSFPLPKELTKKIKENNYDTVEWIIDHDNDVVKINFIKKTRKLPYDEYNDNESIYCRNIYPKYVVKVPNPVSEYLKCELLDDILLKIEDDDVFVEAYEREGLNALSALIGDEEGEGL